MKIEIMSSEEHNKNIVTALERGDIMFFVSLIFDEAGARMLSYPFDLKTPIYHYLNWINNTGDEVLIKVEMEGNEQ